MVHAKTMHLVHKVSAASVHQDIRAIDVKNVMFSDRLTHDLKRWSVLVLSCLDSGEECINGGECIQRPLGDHVCSCPYPYCGLRCQYQRPFCDGKVIHIFDVVMFASVIRFVNGCYISCNNNIKSNMLIQSM